MRCSPLDPPQRSFEVLPLSLQCSTTPSSSLSSCHPLFLSSLSSPTSSPSLHLSLDSHWFFSQTTDTGTRPFTGECFKVAAGSRGRSSGSQILTHTHRRLSQQRRYLFHTHNTLTEPVSASETLNRCTPPPKPFAPQVISSKCVHTGMSPRGVVVRMV